MLNLIYFIWKISTQKIEIWLFEVQAVDYNSATDKACFFLNFNQGYSLQINIVDKIIWSKYKGLHRSYNICWDNNVLYKLDKVYIEKVWTKLLSLWKEAVLYLDRDWLRELAFHMTEKFEQRYILMVVFWAETKILLHAPAEIV